MKIFRRTLFFALITGILSILCIIMRAGPDSHSISPFALLSLGSVLGLLVWALVFLKAELFLARIAFLIVGVCLVFIILMIPPSLS